MTKAAKARRRRAERERAQSLDGFVTRLKHGGAYAHRWELSETEHARLEMAAKLGCVIVMRRESYDSRKWGVYAVREP